MGDKREIIGFFFVVAVVFFCLVENNSIIFSAEFSG